MWRLFGCACQNHVVMVRKAGIIRLISSPTELGRFFSPPPDHTPSQPPAAAHPGAATACKTSSIRRESFFIRRKTFSTVCKSSFVVCKWPLSDVKLPLSAVKLPLTDDRAALTAVKLALTDVKIPLPDDCRQDISVRTPQLTQ